VAMMTLAHRMWVSVCSSCSSPRSIEEVEMVHQERQAKITGRSFGGCPRLDLNAAQRKS